MSPIDVVQKLMSMFPERTYEEFVQVHNKGIGGTETSSILGCNPWMTETALYYKKIEVYEDKDSIPKKRGRILEPLIQELYEKETGNQVFPMANRIFLHPDQDYSRGALDALAITPDDKLIVVDFKSVVGRGAIPWYGDIPPHVKVQLQKYMWITSDLIRMFIPEYTDPVIGDIAALIDDQFLLSNHIGRDFELWDIIKEADRKFWIEHFIPRVPPTPHSLEDIRMVYRQSVDKSRLEADPTVIELLNQYSIVNNKISDLVVGKKKWEDILDVIKGDIILYMKDKEYLYTNNGAEEIVLATYIPSKNNVRTLRVKINNLSLLDGDNQLI